MKARSYRPLLRRWLEVVTAVGGVVCILAVLIWQYDPPLRTNLVEGSIVSWQRSENPYPGTYVVPFWLVVKTDDGRTVGVASYRSSRPTEGERVLVQERVGLLGISKFYETPTR
jgi:hypothetical protein